MVFLGKETDELKDAKQTRKHLCRLSLPGFVDYLTTGSFELYATPDYKIVGFACDGGQYPAELPDQMRQGEKLSSGKLVQFFDEFFNENAVTYEGLDQ